MDDLSETEQEDKNDVQHLSSEEEGNQNRDDAVETFRDPLRISPHETQKIVRVDDSFLQFQPGARIVACGKSK